MIIIMRSPAIIFAINNILIKMTPEIKVIFFNIFCDKFIVVAELSPTSSKKKNNNKKITQHSSRQKGCI